jgi:hypothetical protein
MKDLETENPNYKLIACMTEMAKSHQSCLDEFDLIDREMFWVSEGSRLAHRLHSRAAGDGDPPQRT